jgi:cobalt-precorrin-5B (C1)-methyltransferase
VSTPSGIRVSVPVEALDGVASCRKYPGDYPGDVTAGILFIAECILAEHEIMLYPGEGIGRFSRNTPRHRKGEPAISTPALFSILNAIHEALSITGFSGIIIHLKIPDGQVVAERTLNPHVGIEGGISVLGTTGLVEPWNDHLTETVVERVRNTEKVVITTGRTGLRYARLLFPEFEAVLAGAHIEAAIAAARGSVILCGLPALILRFLDPELPGTTGFATIEEFSLQPEFSERMLAAFAKGKEKYPGLRIVIVDRNGTVMGDSG